jgi:hypothetical protein
MRQRAAIHFVNERVNEWQVARPKARVAVRFESRVRPPCDFARHHQPRIYHNRLGNLTDARGYDFMRPRYDYQTETS